MSVSRFFVLCAGVLAAEDNSPHCTTWAKSGECEKNKVYMQKACAKSCAGKGGASVSPGADDGNQAPTQPSGEKPELRQHPKQPEAEQKKAEAPEAAEKQVRELEGALASAKSSTSAAEKRASEAEKQLASAKTATQAAEKRAAEAEKKGQLPKAADTEAEKQLASANSAAEASEKRAAEAEKRAAEAAVKEAEAKQQAEFATSAAEAAEKRASAAEQRRAETESQLAAAQAAAEAAEQHTAEVEQRAEAAEQRAVEVVQRTATELSGAKAAAAAAERRGTELEPRAASAAPAASADPSADAACQALLVDASRSLQAVQEAARQRERQSREEAEQAAARIGALEEAAAARQLDFQVARAAPPPSVNSSYSSDQAFAEACAGQAHCSARAVLGEEEEEEGACAVGAAVEEGRSNGTAHSCSPPLGAPRATAASAAGAAADASAGEDAWGAFEGPAGALVAGIRSVALRSLLLLSDSALLVSATAGVDLGRVAVVVAAPFQEIVGLTADVLRLNVHRDSMEEAGPCAATCRSVLGRGGAADFCRASCAGVWSRSASVLSWACASSDGLFARLAGARPENAAWLPRRRDAASASETAGDATATPLLARDRLFVLVWLAAFAYFLLWRGFACMLVGGVLVPLLIVLPLRTAQLLADAARGTASSGRGAGGAAAPASPMYDL